MRLDWHRFSVPLGVTDKQGRTHAPVVQLNLPHVDWERYDKLSGTMELYAKKLAPKKD